MHEDLELLRRVIQEPVRQMILAGVNSSGQARVFARQMRDWCGSARPVAKITFDANQDDPTALIQQCHTAVEDWTDDDDYRGLLIVCDASPSNARNDTTARFWRGMNLLRERWDALPSQTIFLITPEQYRLFTTEADHLKRWVSLKVNLRGLGDLTTPERSGVANSRPIKSIEGLSAYAGWDDLQDKGAAQRSQEALREQLREAFKRDEPQELLAPRYYLPLLAAAITLNSWEDASRLNDIIAQGSLSMEHHLRWLRLRTHWQAGRRQDSEAIETAQQWLRLAKEYNNQWQVLNHQWQVLAALEDLIELYRQCNDWDQAQKYYKEALAFNPKEPAFLGSYANFLHTIRHDYEEAETFYKRALEVDPNNAADLNNYANLLYAIRHDYDEAETFYKRALEADSTYAGYIGNYANFLHQVRHDYEQAEELYKRALEVDPNDANHLGNYAQLLLSQGRRDEGEAILSQAETEHDLGLPLQAELAFYRYAHFPNDTPSALSKVKDIVMAGGRSPGWNLEPNIARARQAEHPNVPLLEALSAVIAGRASLESLQDSPDWQSA